MTTQSSINKTPFHDKDQPSPFFEAAQVSSVGMEMAVATLVGWGFGYWLDSKWETGPWLMLLGLLIGVTAGFKGLLRTARQVNQRQARRQQESQIKEEQELKTPKLRREVL